MIHISFIFTYCSSSIQGTHLRYHLQLVMAPLCCDNFSVFDDFDNIEEYWSCVPYWNVSDVFLIRLGLCICVRKTTVVKCYSHHIRLRVHIQSWLLTVGIDLHHLEEVIFVRFLHCKDTLSSLSTLPYRKEVTVNKIHLRGEELCFFFLGGGGKSIYITYLKFFCMEDLPIKN